VPSEERFLGQVVISSYKFDAKKTAFLDIRKIFRAKGLEDLKNLAGEAHKGLLVGGCLGIYLNSLNPKAIRNKIIRRKGTRNSAAYSYPWCNQGKTSKMSRMDEARSLDDAPDLVHYFSCYSCPRGRLQKDLS
jgi:hypothetical protein